MDCNNHNLNKNMNIEFPFKNEYKYKGRILNEYVHVYLLIGLITRDILKNMYTTIFMLFDFTLYFLYNLKIQLLLYLKILPKL